MRQAATTAPDRQAFYDRITGLSMSPLWERFGKLITAKPETPCVPYRWAWRDVRSHLLEAGGLISAAEAERRVLILENPGLRGQSCITESLFAGMQLVQPGEIARCHRHTQSALRLILEGSGAYTAVDGEPVYMERGDFIITGTWCWHDHGNDTGAPAIWLDGLDMPMVRFFGASFAERYGEESFPRGRPPGDNQARFAANMLPVGHKPAAVYSPVFSYPYARSREALETLRQTGELDAHDGLKMEYINPVDGGSPLPTISSFIQLLPKSFRGAPYRSTDGTVYAVIEGRGESQVGGVKLTWEPGDVFVAPSWSEQRHHATEDSVLFSFSDRVVQQKLGLWREERGAA
jgi:gentisate 1,2-dioxygenase